MRDEEWEKISSVEKFYTSTGLQAEVLMKGGVLGKKKTQHRQEKEMGRKKEREEYDVTGESI